MSANPFKVGDRVRFVPGERLSGWSWSDETTIRPNDIGVVSRVTELDYIYIKRDDGRDVGGFHWQSFQLVAEGSASVSIRPTPRR